MSKYISLIAVALLAVQATAAAADTKAKPITKSTQSIPVVAGAASIPAGGLIIGFAAILFAVTASSGSHGSNVGN